MVNAGESIPDTFPEKSYRDLLEEECTNNCHETGKSSDYKKTQHRTYLT